MSDFITVARPYAKAAFDFAVEQNAVENWQSMLGFAAEVSRNESIKEVLSGALAHETVSELFLSVCGDSLDESGQNFIKVMSENGRLLVLPDVLAQFNEFKAEKESTITVDVVSALALTDAQQDKIAAAMEKRLSRKVKLNCKIDKSVMGGVIIRAGDLVIDGSIRGRLNRLTDDLQS